MVVSGSLILRQETAYRRKLASSVSMLNAQVWESCHLPDQTVFDVRELHP